MGSEGQIRRGALYRTLGFAAVLVSFYLIVAKWSAVAALFSQVGDLW